MLGHAPVIDSSAYVTHHYAKWLQEDHHDQVLTEQTELARAYAFAMRRALSALAARGRDFLHGQSCSNECAESVIK